MDERVENRSAIIELFGGDSAVVAELLVHNQSIAARGGVEDPMSVLCADEPHVEVWREYAAEAAESDVSLALGKRLVQLRFPIEEGISQTAAYRAATRQGTFPLMSAGLGLEAPERLELSIHSTPAGGIPILISGNRRDFESLVRALTGRNEPVRVPGSMGACMVKGLVNWDRVSKYRRQWEAGDDGDRERQTWQDEFRVFAQKKELYQDRFIILSRGPYSAVEASLVDLDEDDWQERSVALRRAHECFHYFTLRSFGTMKNNLLDEVIADLAGIVEAFRAYRSDLALLFLGLEGFPALRPGGRFENYRGDPELSDEAVRVQAALVHQAIRNLGSFWEHQSPGMDGPAGLDAILRALCNLSLEEIAADGLAERLSE